MAFLPLTAPYDFRLSTSRFRAYGPDPATLWQDDPADPDGGALWRVVAGRSVRIVAAPAERGSGVLVEAGAGSGPDAAVEAEVAHLLGAPFDTAGFAAFVAASADVALQQLHGRFSGFRPPLAPAAFEALVTAITAQQVSPFSAFAVRGRFSAAFGLAPAAAPGAPPALHAFPEPEALAGVDPAELVPLGFSRRKAEYVVGVAQALTSGSLGDLAALPDREVKERLVAVRGLGEWTADWFLARHLARPQAWPAGDLVLRKACSRHVAAGRELTTPEVRALAARFAPFENLTANLLLLGSTLP